MPGQLVASRQRSPQCPAGQPPGVHVRHAPVAPAAPHPLVHTSFGWSQENVQSSLSYPRSVTTEVVRICTNQGPPHPAQLAVLSSMNTRMNRHVAP